MIKKLVLVFVVLLGLQSYAQEGTASPYSYYGIGSLKFKGTVENRSMGGLSIYNDSIHINLRNPASYGGNNLLSYNNEARPVKFAVGGGHSAINLKSDSEEAKTSTTTFDYIALEIPVGKLGFGLGLMPYTSVGYKLENHNGNGDITNRFRGEGGLNKVYFAAGYQLTKGLSIGVDANYNFGNIQNSTIEFQYNSDGELVQYQTREDNRSDLSGLNMNFGLSYKTMLNSKLEFMSGLTYSPQSNITSQNEQALSTITISATTGQEFIINTIQSDLDANGLRETDLTLPSKFSIGAGIGEPRKWFAGIEYGSIKTSNLNNELYSSVNTTFNDGSTFSVGGFYIPQYNSFTSYWKRTVYRAGLRFENTGLEVNNEAIKEFGISFGLGLQVGGIYSPFSNANIGFELGKRGTTSNNLIQENFFNVNISLSLSDRWFQKQKYN
ncbi:MAG TPA: hypothetical protein VKZ97_04250 [Flavobacteriaceae bacterium]|nr:hypothetical protein [Flavobacteriaceae bacterium]